MSNRAAGLTQLYLEVFFREKNLSYTMYEIEDEETGCNLIDSEQVIDLVLQAPDNEQKTIAHTLRQIDFANGNVHHFLKYLGECFIRQARVQSQVPLQ